MSPDVESSISSVPKISLRRTGQHHRNVGETISRGSKPTPAGGFTRGRDVRKVLPGDHLSVVHPKSVGLKLGQTRIRVDS